MEGLSERENLTASLMPTKILKKRNYIRVDTTTKKRILFIENNINKFRANQLPGAAKEYKNQQH